MWDTYVEPNLPAEPDPAKEKADMEASAIAAAVLAARMGMPGADMAKVKDALKRSL